MGEIRQVIAKKRPPQKQYLVYGCIFALLAVLAVLAAGLYNERGAAFITVCAVLAAAIAVYEAFRHEWLFMLIALLVLLACFFSKEHLVTPEGVDIQRTLFGRTSHDLWTWEEVTAIRIDRKKVMPNVILHISRDVVVRPFTFTPQDAQAVLDLARERNPSIQVSRMAGS